MVIEDKDINLKSISGLRFAQRRPIINQIWYTVYVQYMSENENLRVQQFVVYFEPLIAKLGFEGDTVQSLNTIFLEQKSFFLLKKVMLDKKSLLQKRKPSSLQN